MYIILNINNIIIKNFKNFFLGYLNMSSIEDRIKKIISDQLNVKLEDISNDKHFINDLGADSLDVIELIMALEEEFDIEISDEKAEKISTVQSVIDCINSLKLDK